MSNGTLYGRIHKGENPENGYECIAKIRVMYPRWVTFEAFFNSPRDNPVRIHLSPKDALKLAMELVASASRSIKSSATTGDLPTDEALQFATKLIGSTVKQVDGLQPCFNPSVPSENAMRAQMTITRRKTKNRRSDTRSSK